MGIGQRNFSKQAASVLSTVALALMLVAPALHAEQPTNMRMTYQELEAIIANFPKNQPLEAKGKPYTFGWEAETNPYRAKEVVNEKRSTLSSWTTSWDRYTADKFDWLDDYIEEEKETKNIEFMSKPFNEDGEAYTFGEATGQMRTFKAFVGNGMSNFHLHVRIPRSVWTSIPADELNAWISRFADYIVAYRLRYMPDNEWALNAATQSRLYPSSTSDRGAIRAQTNETKQRGNWPYDYKGMMDIELRGFVNNIDDTERAMKILLHGFENPHLIRGFAKQQARMLQPKQNFVQAVREYAKRQHGESLTENEVGFLEGLDRWVGDYDNSQEPIYYQKRSYDGTTALPLVGFEDAPWFSNAEAKDIRAARDEFLKKVYKMAVAYGDEGYDYADDDGIWRVQEHIKTWAEKIDLEGKLERSLLLDPDRVERFLEERDLPQNPDLEKLGVTRYPELLKLMREATGKERDALAELANKYIDFASAAEIAREFERAKSTDAPSVKKLHRLLADNLRGRHGDKAEAAIRAGLSHPDKETKKRAAQAMVGKRTSSSLKLMKDAHASGDKIAAAHAQKALLARDDAPAESYRRSHGITELTCKAALRKIR